jgi:hypothetical protein
MHLGYSVGITFLMLGYSMVNYGYESSNEILQWNRIKSLLSLNDTDMSLIKEKVGAVSLDHLNKFTESVERLVAQKVSDDEIHPQDALLIDRDNHEVLVDNDYIRILWITLAARKVCVPHTHQWPSVTLIISGLKFLAHKDDGRIVEEEWLPGVYELAGDTNLEAFTNISDCDYKGLAVELKHTMPTNISSAA